MIKPIRLQKFLAQCGVASRRGAEEMIRQGRISIDGKIVTTQGIKIVPNKQNISLDGKPVTPADTKIYILLNKPKGYVTTLSDPQGRPIVTSLLKDIDLRVFPVGRLDLDTEGALILTNDGELAQRVQHPSYEVKKTYEAVVKGKPTANSMRQLEKGILVEGKMTAPAQVTTMGRLQRSTRIKITIHEGRKRQVRKMFQAIGYPVISLKRIAYGRLFLRKLPLGKYRILSTTDLKNIFL